MLKNKAILILGILFSLTACSFDLNSLINKEDNSFFNEKPYLDIEGYLLTVKFDKIQDILRDVDKCLDNCLVEITEEHHNYYDESITCANHLKEISEQKKIDYSMITTIDNDEGDFNFTFLNKYVTKESINHQNEYSIEKEFFYSTHYIGDNGSNSLIYSREDSVTSGVNSIEELKTTNLYSVFNSASYYLTPEGITNLYSSKINNMISDIYSFAFYESPYYKHLYNLTDGMPLVARNSNVEVISSSTIGDNLIRKRLETVTSYVLVPFVIKEYCGNGVYLIRTPFYYLKNISYSKIYYSNGNDDGDRFSKSRIYDQVYGSIEFNYQNLDSLIVDVEE